jgi:Domain of unknown function (DUF1840)
MRRMLYKFRSKATGDLIMLPAHGDTMLRLLGREPSAKGIFEAADQPALIVALETAIAEAEAAPPRQDVGKGDGEAEPDPARSVGLRQRLWPMIEMLRRCQAAGEPVVWGV